MPPARQGPRARYREHTREEIKTIALAHMAEGGVSALALTRIAKELGMSGPAMYRYFANRDDLLSALVRDAYRDLGTRITEADTGAGSASPRERLHLLAGAYRAWALEEPHRYLLIAGSPLPGYRAPEDTVLLARAALGPVVAVFAETDASAKTAPLAEQFAAWAERDPAVAEWAAEWTVTRRAAEATGSALAGGVVAWTRMHGPVALEVSGHFTGMGFDPGTLLHGEIEALADLFGLS